MKITKFKKYISWNLISLMGYFSIIFMVIFLIILGLSSTQLNMRIDLNKYVYEFIFKHVINPYISFYKFQLSTICLLLLTSAVEKKHYDEEGSYGFRIFENNDETYTKIFTIGLFLNFCPLYVFSLYLLKILTKIF